MSKLSLYETEWTNLVFENKNKEYGAYQLRQESSKTSITALFMGLSLLVALGSVSMLISKLRPHEIIEPEVISCPIATPIVLDKIVQPKKTDPIVAQTQKHPAASAPVTSRQLTNPVVAHAEDAVQEIATNKQNTPTTDNTNGTGSVTNAIPTTGGGESGTTILPVEPPSPYNVGVLDKMPEFPGGIAKFYTYVGNNFSKPELDAERTLRVYVSFVIEKDGTMTDIVVKNDPGYGMGREAIRVLKSLKTKWAPGILDGKAVRTAYNLPITIKTETE